MAVGEIVLMPVGNLALLGIGEKLMHKLVLGRFHGLFVSTAAGGKGAERNDYRQGLFHKYLFFNNLLKTGRRIIHRLQGVCCVFSVTGAVHGLESARRIGADFSGFMVYVAMLFLAYIG